MIPLLILLASCTAVKHIDWEEIVKRCKEAYDECKEDCSCPEPTTEPTIEPTPSIPVTPTPTPEPTTEPTTEPVVLPKTDCKNPKSYIKKGDGFKCLSSSTRGGTTVCLLPYTLSRPPFKTITDHHNQTFKASINQNFERVELILRNKKRIKLSFAGQHNPVYLYNDKIAREHWRDSSTQWDNIKNKVVRLEAFYKGDKVCLKP